MFAHVLGPILEGVLHRTFHFRPVLRMDPIKESLVTDMVSGANPNIRRQFSVAQISFRGMSHIHTPTSPPPQLASAAPRFPARPARPADASSDFLLAYQ